ncbi:TetR/AcrR family transcriptional regulator [Clostridium cylindrosporum]|uniref:TetR family transcriptional regulator n=1 Tax=Clostridium cylindrosporum DSM 605 TaxID=1121307 RepID=A0A0J8DA68_CLOCY|nr:TetR/AcrR family transcriptional regulator [Clostridium cylindrosporum]KMT22747.1 TetR family transcriptional regulator [Clostridium cylindrosporum DSM 605]
MNKTKKVIFDAAIKSFSKKGYHKSTMDEIAEAAGVAKGTLYYHFKSKEDIFKFIIDEGIKMIKEELYDKTKHLDDPTDKLRKVCEVQLKLVITYLPFFKTVLSQMWGDEDRQTHLREVLKKYFVLLEGYLLEAADESFINKNNIEIIAFNFFGVMTSTVVYNITHKDIDIEEVLDNLVEFLMRGIGKK